MKAEYVTHSGDDLLVANAARVSFHKESKKEFVGINQKGPVYDINAGDKKLIKYLASHGHFTPFTHCIITLREKVPIFVARQRFKHTVGFSYNEVSRRYVDDEPEFFKPAEWRGRAENKKQGSSDERISVNPVMMLQYHEGCLKQYKTLLSLGVAPEQARMVLPQSMYTEYYTTGSLSAFARAYKLRSSPDAQAEIQQLAKDWDKIIRPLFPHSWEALTNGT